MENNHHRRQHRRNLSILMFPWLAHGHISPFIELAKRLSTKNIFTIYICSTPAALCPVKLKLGSKYSESIKLLELHLPKLPNLSDPRRHTTNGLPHSLMPTLKEAFNRSVPDFCKILETLKPDLLIYDSLQPWAPKAASALNIPAVDFITSSPVMTSFMMHALLTVDDDHHKKGKKDFISSKIFYRGYEADLYKGLINDVDKHRSLVEKIPVIECMELSTKIILIKGFDEIDGKYSNYVTNLSGKKVIPVGPLVQEYSGHDDDDDMIIAWLDKKEKKSTIFVSFGSEYFLSQEERVEIARGLELSDKNFVWVIRFPKGEELVLEDARALPEGFLKRVTASHRGKVIEGWAPQARILNHASIGGFVSHCGWSSILESMKCGVPIVAVPMHLDQPINARLVEEVGAGVEVLKDKDGRLDGKLMAEVIKEVMDGENKGEIVRKKVENLRGKIEERGEGEMDRVVEELVKLCSKKVTNGRIISN